MSATRNGPRIASVCGRLRVIGLRLIVNQAVDVRPTALLLERGSVVICGSGCGIPVRSPQSWHSVEAVIDKARTIAPP